MSTWSSLLIKQKTYEITKLLPETEYTVSINGIYDEPIEVWLTALTTDENGIVETEVNQGDAVYVGDLEYSKLTFTAQELHTDLVIRTQGDLDLNTIQLEKGTLGTDWAPAPEDFNALKGTRHNLSQTLQKDQYYTLSLESEVDEFVGAWLGDDVHLGYLKDNKLTFKLTEQFNHDHIILKSFSENGTISKIKLEQDVTSTSYSPAPEDGYGLDLPNGAWHMQYVGGTSAIKSSVSFKFDEGQKQTSSVDIKSFTRLIVQNNGLDGYSYAENERHLYQSTLVSDGVGFMGINFSAFVASDNLDFIASDPFIATVVPQYSAQSTEVSNVFNPISQVQVYWDDASAFVAGTDIGSTIVINTPWATQSSTDYIHSILNGYQYIPAQGTRVYADPATQLGDTFTYGDTDQLVASVIWHFDGSVTGNFDAPQNNDYNFDDPQSILMQNEFKKKISLGDSYQGVSIGRQDGIQMLLSPDGSEENAIGRYYADLNRGMAFQTRDTIMSPWQNWLYFDMQEKVFKLSLYSTTEEVDMKVDGVNEVVKENASSIEINAQGIQQEIMERTTQGELILEQTSSLVQQTAADLSVIFSKLEADQDLTNGEIELIQSYFRINENGVIIGKSNSPIQFFAENNRVGFRENGNDIAYWEEGTMHVDRLIAVTTIMVGYHLIEKYDSPVAGNTTIVRIGD